MAGVALCVIGTGVAVLYGIRDAWIDIDASARFLAADQHSLSGLVRRFPSIHMPVSTWSMRAANLDAIIDLLDRLGPQTIVELGSGISTLYIAAWLAQHGSGRLISIDHDPKWARKTQTAISAAGLEAFVQFHTCPLRPRSSFGRPIEWYDADAVFQQIKTIDVLIVDGPPQTKRPLSRLPAMEIALPKLAANAAVFLDDANRTSERRIIDLWCKAFPGWNASIVQTLTGYGLLTRDKT